MKPCDQLQIEATLQRPRMDEVVGFTIPQGSFRLRARSGSAACHSTSEAIEMLKTTIKVLGKKLGYDIVPLWRRDKLELANLLQSIFGLHDIKVVLDVGANKGQFAEFLRLHVGFTGRIVSFEPILENVEHLRALSAADGAWDVVGCALGSTDTEAEINIMKADVFSSFHQPNALSAELFGDWNVVDRVERVSVRRLDSIAGELGLDFASSATYMKCDTQGHDLDVIDGCGVWLEHVRALQTEVSVIGIYEGMPTMNESLDTLGSRGFAIAGLYPVSRDEAQRVIEFDAVLVNDRFCTNKRSG